MVEASQLGYVQTKVTCEQLLQTGGRQDVGNASLLCVYTLVVLCCIPEQIVVHQR